MMPPVGALMGLKRNKSVEKGREKGMGLGKKIGLGVLAYMEGKHLMNKGAFGLIGKVGLAYAGVKLGSKALDTVKDKMQQGKLKTPREALMDGKEKATASLRQFDKTQEMEAKSYEAQAELSNAIEAPSY